MADSGFVFQLLELYISAVFIPDQQTISTEKSEISLLETTPDRLEVILGIQSGEVVDCRTQINKSKDTKIFLS